MSSTKIPVDGKESPEYKAIQHVYTRLASVLNPDTLALGLFETGLLPNPPKGDEDSAALIKLLMNHVERDAMVFYKFLGVLNALGTGSSYVLTAIHEKFVDAVDDYIKFRSAVNIKADATFLSFSRIKCFEKSIDAHKFTGTLFGHLDDMECNPWMDAEDLGSGDYLGVSIFKTLQKCKAIVPIVARGYAQSLWCMRELYYAKFTKSTQVYPVVIEDGWQSEDVGKWLEEVLGEVKFTSTNTQDIKRIASRIAEALGKNPNEYKVDVTNAYLSQMEWIEDGQVKVVSIYDEASRMWREIGINLGLDSSELDAIKQDSISKRGRVIRVFSRWQENAYGLPRADKYPKSWKGLMKLLKQSGLAKLADKVHKALLQQKDPWHSAASKARVLPVEESQYPGEQHHVLEVHVKTMKSSELTNYLSKVMDIDDYGEDIQKLRDNRISGKSFLTLPENQRLLDRLNLSIGGEEEIRSIVKSLKEESLSSDKSVYSASDDSMDSDQDSLLREPNQPWCSTGPPSPTMQSGFVPLDSPWSWKGYRELRVEFLEPIPAGWTVGNGAQMNKENILAWANVWNQKGDGHLPRFVEVKPGEDAQIRIKFNSFGLNNSVLGKRAQNVPVDEPTMNLDLHQGGRIKHYFKRHVVIHEFGHALGLGHEHQRSNFWLSIERFTDTTKMKGELRVTNEKFGQDWNAKVDSESGHHTEYDPDSIMHYWFNKDWLISHYRNEGNIKKDRDSKKLTADEAKALLGVHKRYGQVAHEPSVLDLKLLKELYGGGATPTAGAPSTASILLNYHGVGGIPVQVMTDEPDYSILRRVRLPTSRRLGIDDLVDVKNELWSVRTHWRGIGENLRLPDETLKFILIREREGPGACLREMLSSWLSKSSTPERPITWASLVSALQMVEGCDDVAQAIAKKHLGGN